MSDIYPAFWSSVASQYDRVVDLQIGLETRSLVHDRLADEGPLGVLVELGCGTGYFTAALAAKATRVVATDFSSGMLDLARARVRAPNVTFQRQDCQRTTFDDGAFDTAFMSLLLHFTDPAIVLDEMRRILAPGGALIVANLDTKSLSGLDLVRCRARIVYRGLTGYRTKPPKGFAKGTLSERELCELLDRSGFDVVECETFKDRRRSSHIPVNYVKAVRR